MAKEKKTLTIRENNLFCTKRIRRCEKYSRSL